MKYVSTAENILSLIFPKTLDNVALVDQEGSWTYKELNSISKKLAAYLIEEIGSGKNIIVKMANCKDFVAAILGCLYSANTAVLASDDLAEPELQYLKQKTKCKFIITQINYDQISGYGEVDASSEKNRPFILFTSGTTSFPKGAVISHQNIIHTTSVISKYLDYQHHSSTVIVMPMHYSYVLVNQILTQMSAGGTIYILKNLLNPLELFNWINRYSISTFSGVASIFQILKVFNRIEKLKADSIRVLCSAGAHFDYELFPVLKEIFPNSLIFNNYGLTEAIPRISFSKETDPTFFRGSCGKPIEGVEARIWSRSSNSFLPEGEEGVLVVKGPNLIEEYWDDPAATKNSFTKDNFFITGDLALIKNSEIYISGREDDVFNSGGEKISPYEIEFCLKKHQAAEEVLVAGLPDAQKGKKVAAFLVLKEEVSKDELLKHCRKNLSQHKIPVKFYRIDKLPLTSNNKVLRRELFNSEYQTREIR